jgi:hypothetical protein
MKIWYRPLFTLEVTHTFYAERCLDFRFVYPSDTARWLSNGRVIARERDGMLYMLYEADEAGNPLVTIPAMTFRIGLQLVNPYFSNFTELPDSFPGRRLRYRNAAAPGVLDAVTEIPFSAAVFSHVLTDAARPVTVALTDEGGAVLQSEVVEASDQRTAVSFDVRGHPSGVLTVEETFPASSNTVLYYLDPELQQLDAAAIVEVTIDNAFYETPPAFQIAFVARTEALNYYVVATRYTPAEFDLISVADQGFADDGRAEIGFTKILPADFTPEEISPSLVSGSDDRLVLFKSGDLLARQEKSRKRIQLSKNGDVLIANLPQPGADRAKAELIIHLSKP